MQTTRFYRRIIEFKEVLSNQVTNSLVENSTKENIDRDSVANISRDVSRVIEAGFNNMIDSLQSLERQMTEEDKSNKKTGRRKKS